MRKIHDWRFHAVRHYVNMRYDSTPQSNARPERSVIFFFFLLMLSGTIITNNNPIASVHTSAWGPQCSWGHSLYTEPKRRGLVFPILQWGKLRPPSKNRELTKVPSPPGECSRLRMWDF